MKKSICFLVKFFKEEAHAQQFIRGNLYLNRLSYFKKNGDEDTDEDGRPDEYEAISHLFQPKEIEISIIVPELNHNYKITDDDLASPAVYFSNTRHQNYHVYCMTAMNAYCCDSPDKKLEPKEIESVFREQLKVNEGCIKKLGSYAVILPAKQFLERAKIALQSRGEYFNGKLVDYYYDENKFHGEIEENEIPFNKRKKFSYQNEYRIILDTKTAGENPITINIGSLEDISSKVVTPTDIIKFMADLKIIDLP